MSWTEPTYSRAFITAETLDHPGILQRISLYQGEQAGNKISIPYFIAGTVATVNVDSITASSRNDEIMTLTATDRITRTALKGSEYQTMLNDRSMQMKLVERHAIDLRMDMEDYLDTELATSTNTVALTTDNTFTIALFTKGLADPLEGGASIDDLTFTCGAAGWASLVAAGYANAGGVQGDIQGSIGLIFGRVPCIVSAQTTIATTTGGAAGYLWAKQGIVCALGDVSHVGPVYNSGTGSYDVVSTMYHAFDTVEGADSRFVVKFTNP